MTPTARTRYDVVIAGSGFAGANMAWLLARAGRRVLILEAGPGLDTLHGDNVERYVLSTFKSPSAPYPPAAGAGDPSRTNAPRPTVEALATAWNDPARSYFEYAAGSLPFGSTYERLAGGTGNHWMGTAIRMDGADFALRSTYGRGLDWPIGYAELASCYDQAEHLVGVAGDRTEQEQVNGIPYTEGHEYPMEPIAPSYGDRVFKARVDGARIAGDVPAVARTTSTPAGRNSRPFMNRGPCRGSTSCVPICPVRAKYDPRVALGLALDTGRVDMLAKAVVDHVTIDPGGVVTGLHYLTYDDVSVPAARGRTGEGVATGSVYVLAAHAVENARILLNSERVTGQAVANSSGLVGRHLMDHPVHLAWGLLPEGTPFYGYRGPLATSGIETLRDGPFRRRRAAWRIEIGNAGWGLADRRPLPDRGRLRLRKQRRGTQPGAAHPVEPPVRADGQRPPDPPVPTRVPGRAGGGSGQPDRAVGHLDGQPGHPPAAPDLPPLGLRAGRLRIRERGNRADHGAARRDRPHGGARHGPHPVSLQRPGLRLPGCRTRVRDARHGVRQGQLRGERPAADLGPPQPVPRRLRIDAERRHAEPDAHHARRGLPHGGRHPGAAGVRRLPGYDGLWARSPATHLRPWLCVSCVFALRRPGNGHCHPSSRHVGSHRVAQTKAGARSPAT